MAKEADALMSGDSNFDGDRFTQTLYKGLVQATRYRSVGVAKAFDQFEKGS